MKRFVPGLLLAACLPLVVNAADGLTTEQRLQKMERRVGMVTDLTLRIDSLQRENRELRGQIETLQYQIEQLKRKQRDIYLDIDQRLASIGQQAPAAAAPAEGAPAAVAAPTAPPVADAAGAAPVTDLNRPPGGSAPITPPPAETYDLQQMQADYKAAYALLSPAQRRDDDAAKACTAFLGKYPAATLASNAQYWLAEAYYVSQQNDQALQAFNKVISEYPTSPKVPGALYKIGRLEKTKGNSGAARKAWERVLADYPNSSAAGLAKEQLAKLK